jgi:hypothetical protein
MLTRSADERPSKEAGSPPEPHPPGTPGPPQSRDDVTKELCWWALRDSNPRPSPCKGDALPAELSARSTTIGMPARAAHHISQGDGQTGRPASHAPIEALLPIGTIVLAVRADQDLRSPCHRARPRHRALVGIEGGAVAEEAARPVRRPHGRRISPPMLTWGSTYAADGELPSPGRKLRVSTARSTTTLLSA